MFCQIARAKYPFFRLQLMTMTMISLNILVFVRMVFFEEFANVAVPDHVSDESDIWVQKLSSP